MRKLHRGFRSTQLAGDLLEDLQTGRHLGMGYVGEDFSTNCRYGRFDASQNGSGLRAQVDRFGAAVGSFCPAFDQPLGFKPVQRAYQGRPPHPNRLSQFALRCRSGQPRKMQKRQPAGFVEAEGGQPSVDLGAPQPGDQPEAKAELFLIVKWLRQLIACIIM